MASGLYHTNHKANLSIQSDGSLLSELVAKYRAQT